MRRLNLVLGAFALTATVLAHSQALASGITLLGQDRRVHGGAFVTDPIVFDSDTQQFMAPDHGPFEATATATASIDAATSTATGSQISAVMAHVIEARGAFSADAELFSAEAGAFASSESNVALRFSVPEATTYFLVGFVEAADGGFTTLQLSRPFLTVEWFSATNQHLDLSESGAIDAGTYDLNITAHGTANTDTGGPLHASGGYDIHLIFGSATDAPVVTSQRIAAYPNPFVTQTSLSLPENAGRVRIFDLAGRAVRTLEATSSLTWDGRDDAGRALGSGVYWVRLDDVAVEPLKVVRVR